MLNIYKKNSKISAKNVDKSQEQYEPVGVQEMKPTSIKLQDAGFEVVLKLQFRLTSTR